MKTDPECGMAVEENTAAVCITYPSETYFSILQIA